MGETEGGECREHLSHVERLICGVVIVEETHVDEVDEQAGSVFGGLGIVGGPLVEDQQDQIAKEAGHEDDFWDEAQEDVQWLLEVPAVKHNWLRGKRKKIPRGMNVKYQWHGRHIFSKKYFKQVF